MFRVIPAVQFVPHIIWHLLLQLCIFLTVFPLEEEMSAHSHFWIFHKLKIIQKSLLNHFSYCLMSPIWLVFFLKVCFQNLKIMCVASFHCYSIYLVWNITLMVQMSTGLTINTHWPLLGARWLGIPLCYWNVVSICIAACTYWVVPRLTKTTNGFVL